MNEEEYEKYFKYKMKRQEDFYQAFELGAFGDDLPKFAEGEVNKIVKTEWEYKKLQNNWNELKKYADEKLKSAEWLYKNNHIDKFEFLVRKNELLWLKQRIKELEGNNDK